MPQRDERDILEQIRRHAGGREPQRQDVRGRERGGAPERTERQSTSPIAQMDRLFDEVFKRPFFSLLSPRMSGQGEDHPYLPVDIYEDGDAVVVTAEIPGIRKEDLNVELTSDSITISGEKRSEQRVEQKDFFRLERSYGSFSRTCHLPVETVADMARAVFRDGVLEVRIPKSPATQPQARKLTVE